MRVERTDQSPTKAVLKVIAAADDLEPIRLHVLSHFKDVKVPGFRVGKAPARMIEQNVNQQAFLDEFMEHALNELYGRAVNQENIRPINQPKVELKKFVPYTALEFTAETDIIGPIKLTNYKAIKVTRQKPVVTADEVNQIIENLRTRGAERIDKKDAAEAGDEVVIDFAGTGEDGQPIQGGAGEDYPLILGSDSFIPGFEDNLIGADAGQTKQFDLKFPKDYGVQALQGKTVTFKVTVKKVSRLKKPELDDKFAATAGPFKTVKELKDDVKKQLIVEKENQAVTEQQNEIIRKVIEKSQIEVPAALVADEILRLEEQEKQNLAYRGQTWQEHLDAEGVNEEEHRKRHEPEAIERVKAGLVLSEIADEEGLSVTPEELELRLQMLKGQYQDPQMQAELDKPENQRDVQARMLTEKTLAKLTDYASK
jgi:trigger factor